MKTYIVGHKNPDTDSAVSAIILADYFSKLGKEYFPTLAGEVNKETSYILNRFGLKLPVIVPAEEKKIVLVDTTEPAQIHESVKPEEIIAIYDHHNLGGLRTPGPVVINSQPVGCVATVIAEMYKNQNIQPSLEIAGATIATILSDTVKFTSPITTEKDKEMVEWLNSFAKLDIDELADGMFKAKSDISDVSTEELLGKDYKHYEMNGHKIGFGVWETVSPDTLFARKKEIMETLEKKKKNEGLECVFFGIVDILNSSSNMCIVSDKENEIAKAAFGGEVEDGLMSLPGVVSRKKQMIPPLEKYFATN